MKIKENKKRGFTLAEVLITLAIIGVFAALTLPTMIANHQKKVYVVQLQKAVSTLEQGFKMMMADDAVDKLQYTSVFELTLDSENGECQSTDYNNDEACTKFFDAWKKYFNISDISTNHYTEWKSLDGSQYDDDLDDYYFIKLLDGTYMIPLMLLCDDSDITVTIVGEENINILGSVYVDVNGEKGPNTYGRDVFHLYVQPDGILVGMGDGTKETCTSSSYDGRECTSYLMNNGWVMDY